MTTSQFISLRSALVSASLLAEQALARSVNVRQTRYYRHVAEKIDRGLRTLDALEAERTDQPKQQLLDEQKVAS